MFGKIFRGLKVVGKAAFAKRELIAMIVPGGPIVKNAISYVDVLIGGGNDPGTAIARRSAALAWVRKQDPELYSAYTDEEMHVIIQMEFMRKKFPGLF